MYKVCADRMYGVCVCVFVVCLAVSLGLWDDERQTVRQGLVFD